MGEYDYLTLFDGVCDQTKELQTLDSSMSNDVKWIISSSGGYMFVRFAVDSVGTSTGFLAKIHYGNEILNQKLVQRGNNVTVSRCFYKCSHLTTHSAVSPKILFCYIFCQIYQLEIFTYA